MDVIITAMPTERMDKMQENDKRQQEVQESVQEYHEDENAIDLISMLDDAIRCFKKYWPQFLMLVVTMIAAFIIAGNQAYTPQYQAKVTYAVNKTSIAEVDASIAQRLSGSISAVVSTGEFKERLFAGVEPEDVNENYSITSAYTENSNLFAVTVTANNYNNANMVMELFEKMYPEWVASSNGTMELQIVDQAPASDTPVNAYSAVKQLFEGIAVGVILCLMIAAFYAQVIKTVRRESDMKKITSKSCISMIPEIQIKKRDKSKKQHLLLTNRKVDWAFKQSLQAAQLRIEKQMEQENQKVLMISSTLPQEGKSMTAVNLALVFVQHEKKTVLLMLISEDLQLREYWGFRNSRGLLSI